MCHGRLSRIIGCAVIAVAQCLTVTFWPGARLVNAQQLSIRRYDVSDGLAHSHVSAMHQDAKGYLWLATWEGLSRFDGYRFTNYSQRDGLGDPIINAIAEDRQGHLWVATNGGGVARLIADGPNPPSMQSGARQKFISFRVSDWDPSNRVNALLFDSQNNLWCATDGGLYRAPIEQSGPSKFERIVPYAGETSMVAFADRHGRLWFGIENQLIEIVGDQIFKYGADDEVGRHRITSVIEDNQGRLLVANERDLFELVAPAENPGRVRWRRWPLTLKPDQGINVLLNDSGGALWIGTWNGLIKYRDGKQTLYTSAQGLSDNAVASLTKDRDDNLWIGTLGGGVCKLSSELIVTFTRAEGLPNQNVRKVIEDRQGNIYANVENGGLARIVEGRAVALPESQVAPFTDFNERIVQDLHGDWWIGTNFGLYRFRGPELQLRRGQKMTALDGLGDAPMGGLYADSAGRIWVSPKDQGLYCFNQSDQGAVVFKQLIPPSSQTLFRGAQQVISDRSGTLWLAGHEWLGRLINGQVAMLQPDEGLPETRPRALFVDSRGWLWIGLRYRGVSVTKDPSAATPSFSNYSTANGLASDAVWTIAEDDAGRMYFGTGKGLDQFDLTTGRIRHFNTDDGLASDVINYCMKDKGGNIWVGTTLGLSKFNPRVERRADSPAPIYLSRVQIAGEDLPVPETGALQISGLDLSAARNNLSIEYVALSFEGEDKLRYQYKLEGVDKDWTNPTDVRSINYARLAPGSYRFLVRAINQEGVVSTEAASLQFRILRPVWQRWWFLMMSGVLVAMTIYAVHRQRTARLIELERVRTRIATDLHDDIGANLSLIAMLSEVARGFVKHDDRRMKEWFSTIATTSRDTVDAMSDIVWAVNPKRDQLSDLTQRMRRFADDILGARNIALNFRVPEPGRELKVGADLRREVFLIFKESINNIVRHSQCTTTNVELEFAHGWLVLRVSDNGCGLNPGAAGDGTGLASLRARAQKLGGSFEIASSNSGTSLTLKVPLDRRARF